MALQNQAFRGIQKFSGNFNAVCSFLNVILCGVYTYICAVLRCSYPPYALLTKFTLFHRMNLSWPHQAI